jgi:hypothetical protein
LHRAPTIALGPLGDRLRGTPHLLRILERVHAAGPRPVGELLIDFLEASGADPAVLDRLEDWHRLDPEIVRQVGGRDFPRPPLAVLPKARGR